MSPEQSPQGALDADLAAVVTAWPALPRNVQVEILALAKLYVEGDRPKQ